MGKRVFSMQKLGDILIGFNPLKDKYISREFQSYGYYLAEELNDMTHKSLYIKLAKIIPRALLEKAFSYAKDSNSKKRGAVFMRKLKDLGAWQKDKKKDTKPKKQVEDVY
ncbi:hypothetical protein COV53_07030 [Candidatus Gottesmanbacteria bacterium CG11_big_fil_rev_8_21_14_0_20_37_11]|uniref:Uncharacterized protein n=2 Tax=Candidatus Gottesmaniibacteriota TaxID=1752720 RepID=A0A1J4TN78_9BACT|nr:MAG: hypothetical protein AUJ73_04230 [Candidatus Gottesmanbacteria bacterium CG1_02_37_22]PIP33097.1 MAG: hypothetical protein COX23_01210 [Candidatus Gottesmanbacteria bacterium CG23_combo_of_CG06-09_8_20_14_all_37_19]PIR07667.1 MAG: hypothetical protein COV53_07030 [Candidatus Gottesmanbacteria bacterium CG11_big_fil_rev_8_21_14_0_20_37_11]